MVRVSHYIFLGWWTRGWRDGRAWERHGKGEKGMQHFGEEKWNGDYLEGLGGSGKIILKLVWI